LKKKNVTKPNYLGSVDAGWRGFYFPMGGGVSGVANLDNFQATTVQTCGLYPFGVGSALPMIGVPLGHNIFTGTTVCCDPINWFARAKLINNPSMFIFGNPGLGKSTAVRRILIGMAAQGIMPLVLGDLRPDYVDLVRSLDGQVISIQEGSGYINILDPGDAMSGKRIIEEEIGRTDAADIARILELKKALREIDTNTIGYQQNSLFSMITLLRGSAPTIIEGNVIVSALQELNAKFQDSVAPPILQDLYNIIMNPSPIMLDTALCDNSIDKYLVEIKDLIAVLKSLIEGGRFGTIFSNYTSEPMRIDKPVVFDISKLNTSDKALRAAVLIACWTTGFGTVQIAKLLASLGIEKQRHYFLVLDEMHQALGAGIGMVERIDYLTRLNRAEGIGQAMITHTPKDLLALPTQEERMKAAGLVERSGIKLLGGLSSQDADTLDDIFGLSGEEKRLISSWQSPAGYSKDAQPPGRGNFLIKIGGRTGIPVHVSLTRTESEGAVNETSSLWKNLAETNE
jgi:hypothetical protein